MIQWYPGHMTKAKREIQKRLALADVVIEILDARAPLSTSNPDLEDLFKNKPRVIVLNKEDLANPAANQKWIAYYRSKGISAVLFCAVKSVKHALLISAVEKAAAEVVRRWAEKGAVRPVRAMIVGIPNVGKSSIINVLYGEKRAKVGAAPGVTRAQQWVRIKDTLELLDTPGVLWPKFEDQDVARRLAYFNAIRDEVLEPVPLAQSLLEELKTKSAGAISARYKIPTEQADAKELLDAIAKARGCIIRGGELDLERAANLILDDFRMGKIGRITLEWPKEGTAGAAEGN